MPEITVPDQVSLRTDNDGGTLLLDASAGVWFVLNQTGGQLWRAWAEGTTFEDSVAQVAARHGGVPVEVVRADAEELFAALVERNLISSTAAAPGASRTSGVEMVGRRSSVNPERRWNRVALVIPALPMLIFSALLVRVSFRSAVALVRLSRNWSLREPNLRFAEDVAAAVGRCARFYPGRAACLEQSLCCVLVAALLRRRLNWCLGSIPDPYRFHAWAQLGDAPVCDPEYPVESPAFRAALTL